MLDNRCDSAANSVLSPLLHAALRILWNTTEALSANSERRPSTIQKKLAVGLYGHAFFWGWTQPRRKPGWIMRAMPHAYLVLWDLSCTSQVISKQEQVLQGFLFEEKTSQPLWAPFPQLDHVHYKSLPKLNFPCEWCVLDRMVPLAQPHLVCRLLQPPKSCCVPQQATLVCRALVLGCHWTQQSWLGLATAEQWEWIMGCLLNSCKL